MSRKPPQRRRKYLRLQFGPALWTALGDSWWSMVSLPWSPSLELIGNVFDLCGHSGKSAEHRQHKANGVFHRWAPILTNLSLPISERMNAFRVSVASSALWLSACWTLTKTQSNKLGSWSARLLCRMVSCRRRPDESPVDHWCPSQTGTCSRRTVWSGSPATLSFAETPLRWSRGKTEA